MMKAYNVLVGRRVEGERIGFLSTTERIRLKLILK
jgi:hypothetical protein